MIRVSTLIPALLLSASLSSDASAQAGFQFLAKLSQGIVFTGPQSDPGLVSEKGDKAEVGKQGIYLGMRWFMLPWLGVEAESGGLVAIANAPGANSMFISREWSANFGLSLVPWQKELGSFGRIQIVASGGGNYSRLALMDDYTDFVKKNTGLTATDEAASGFGGYAGTQARLLTRFGLMAEIGPRFAWDRPLFPGASKAFGGWRVGADFGVGWMF